MIFSRRTPSSRKNSPRPMLSRSGVAARVDRSPGRISRLYDKGLLPPPDYTDQSEQPYWQLETIDSWWAARDGFDAEDTPRYHRAFRVTGEPMLVDNTVIDVELGHRSEEFHIRTYRGVDGQGPVVLISPLRGDRAHFSDSTFGQIARQYAGDSAHELEYQANTVWFLAVTGWWDSNIALDVPIYAPPHVAVYDLSKAVHDHFYYSEAPYALRHDSKVTATDVARIVGRPFDVFPEEHYTRDAVMARAASADSTSAIKIETDEHNIGRLIQNLNIAAAASNAPHSDPAVTFAANALADTTIEVNKLVVDNTRFVQRIAETRGGVDPSDADTVLPVEPWPRILNASETNLVQRFRLTPPLIGELEPMLPYHGIRVHDIHPDTDTMYQAVGDYLDRNDPPTPLLSAVEHAHTLLAAARKAADPDRRHPHTRSVGRVRMTLNRGVALEYRDWRGLSSVFVDDQELSPGHRRRLEMLISKSGSQPVIECFYDRVNDLFVVETIHDRNTIEPDQWPNELVFEWPEHTLTRDLMTAGATFVQPSAGYGHSVPAWIITNDTWTPVPLASRGFQWGVNSPPDSLSIEAIRAAFPRGTYYEGDNANTRYRHLRGALDELLIGAGPDDLRVPVDTVTALLDDFAEQIATPITAPATITSSVDAAAAVAADSGWRHGRTHGWVYDSQLHKITDNIDTLAAAMENLGWIPADDNVAEWSLDTVELPTDHHHRYMRVAWELLNTQSANSLRKRGEH